MATIEELEAQLAVSRANEATAKADAEAAKARITEVNGEAKGHRLNSDKYRLEAETATKARDEAIAESGRIKAEIEGQANDKVTAAEKKAAEALSRAQERAVNADLKVSAKEAGAHDVADILALLDRSKIKMSAEGEIENAAELLADLKKSKPHLFGAATTSNTKPTPEKTTTAKAAKEMTDAEFDSALRAKAWRTT